MHQQREQERSTHAVWTVETNFCTVRLAVSNIFVLFYINMLHRDESPLWVIVPPSHIFCVCLHVETQTPLRVWHSRGHPPIAGWQKVLISPADSSFIPISASDGGRGVTEQSAVLRPTSVLVLVSSPPLFKVLQDAVAKDVAPPSGGSRWICVALRGRETGFSRQSPPGCPALSARGQSQCGWWTLSGLPQGHRNSGKKSERPRARSHYKVARSYR